MLGRAKVVLLAASLAVFAACSTPSGTPADAGKDVIVPGCALGFLGTPGKPVEMKLISRGADLTSSDIDEGSRVALILPPQGGRVIFIGVKATNISACGLTLTGYIRDTANGQVRVDERTTNLHPTGDGWGQSDDADMSTFANIPLCPNEWASTDADEMPFELTITIKDAAGNTATKTIHVVPFCAEAQYAAECLCTCKKGYVLGQACTDAGP